MGVTGDFVVNENLEAMLAKGEADPFEVFRTWCENLDLLVMTLDATFPGNDPKPGGPHVVTGPSTLEALPRGKRTLLNLGNNHAFDMGLEGYLALLDKARRLGFECVGAGRSQVEAETPWVSEVNGVNVAVHSAVHRGSHPRAPLPCGAQIADVTSASWQEGVRRSTADGHTTIVLIHGGLERCHYPSPAALTISRDLADCGASMIIWSHAHVIQGGERWNGVSVAYGLGNTLYPMLTGDPRRPNLSEPAYDRGLILELRVEPGHIVTGSGLVVRRNGVCLEFDPDSRGAESEQRHLSRRLQSPLYPHFFRALRLWEDVVLHTWKYFRRDSFWVQLRKLNPARFRGLWNCLRNAKADAEDV